MKNLFVFLVLFATSTVFCQEVLSQDGQQNGPYSYDISSDEPADAAATLLSCPAIPGNNCNDFLSSNPASSLWSPASKDYRHHDIRLSYGMFTTNQILDVCLTIIPIMLVGDNFVRTYTSYSGAYTLTYKYSPIKQLAIGLSLGYDAMKGEIKRKEDLAGTFKSSWVSTVLSADYVYLNKKIIQLYSGLAAGATFVTLQDTDLKTRETASDTQAIFNFQINLLGIRVGKALAGYVEAGFGYKGLVNAGISYQF